jgi:transcriptional regulator with XRE-family HTH domain
MKILKNSDFMRGLCYKGFMEPEYEFLPFGPALRRLRRAVGLTQEALADLVEVDQTTISNWEKRSDPLTDSFLMDALADALKTSVDDLRSGRVLRRKVTAAQRASVSRPQTEIEWLTLLQEYNPGLYTSMVEVARQVVEEVERRRFGNDPGSDSDEQPVR